MKTFYLQVSFQSQVVYKNWCQWN